MSKALNRKSQLEHFRKPTSLVFITKNNLSLVQAQILDYFAAVHVLAQETSNEVYYNKNSTSMLPMFNSEPNGKYLTTLADIKNELDITTRNNANLKKQLLELCSTALEYSEIELNEENGTYREVATGSIAYMDHIRISGGYVEYSLSSSFKENINLLRNTNSGIRYAYLNFKTIRSFNSKYALHIYEYILSFSRGKIPKFPLDLFARMIGFPTSYCSDVSRLKDKVLNPAKRQIKQYADLDIEMEILPLNSGSSKKYIKIISKNGAFENELAAFFDWLVTKNAKKKKIEDIEGYKRTLIKLHKENKLNDFNDLFSQFKKETATAVTYQQTSIGNFIKLKNKTPILNLPIVDTKEVFAINKKDEKTYIALFKKALKIKEHDFENYSLQFLRLRKLITAPLKIENLLNLNELRIIELKIQANYKILLIHNKNGKIYQINKLDRKNKIINISLEKERNDANNI